MKHSEAVYTIETVGRPGVQYKVTLAEYERLTDLGQVATLVAVSVPADEIEVNPIEPVNPSIGLVWANPSFT